MHSKQYATGIFVAIAVGLVTAARADNDLARVPQPPTDFSQLTLNQTLALFDQHNRELLEARRAVDATQADVLTARQHPNPTLSVNTSSFNPDRGRVPGGFWDQPYDTIVRLDQPIERGNKRTLRVGAAKAMLAASRADLQDATRQLRTQTQAAYYDLLLAQEKVSINTEAAQLYTKTLDATEFRLRAGDVSPVDVTRIRVEALKSQNDAQQAQAERAKAQTVLAYLIGAEARATELYVIDVWPSVSNATTPEALDSLLARRPDVQAAEARRLAALRNRDYARALRTRDITVGVQYEHEPPDKINTYGVGFSFPLLLGYAYEGEIQRAETQLLASDEALEKTRAQALTELANLHTDLDAAAARQRRYDAEIVPQSLKAMEATEFAYQHGARNVLELIDARRTLHAAQLDATAARADYAKALSAWTNAVAQYNGNT